jgi:hypothetical protein
MTKYFFEEVQRLFDKGDLPALFDMVWRAGEAEGEQNERERIAKLLEESPRLQPTTDLFLEFTEGYIAGFEDAIAITKVKVKGDSVSGLPLEDVVTIHKSLKKGEQK